MRIWTDKTVDQEFTDLGTAGHTGTLNDRQFSYLRGSGFSGSLPDMLRENSFSAPPYVPPTEDPQAPPVGEPDEPTVTPDPDWTEPNRIDIVDSSTVVRTSNDPGTFGVSYISASLVGGEYWEYEVQAGTPKNATFAIGITTLALPLNGIPGERSTEIAWWSDGTIQQGGVTILDLGSAGALVKGDTAGIARDSSGNVFLWKNCAALNAAAAVGTLNPGSAIYPFVALYSVKTKIGMNFTTATFNCPLPSGFYEIGSAPTPPDILTIDLAAAPTDADFIIDVSAHDVVTIITEEAIISSEVFATLSTDGGSTYGTSYAYDDLIWNNFVASDDQTNIPLWPVGTMRSVVEINGLASGARAQGIYTLQYGSPNHKRSFIQHSTDQVTHIKLGVASNYGATGKIYVLRESYAGVSVITPVDFSVTPGSAGIDLTADELVLSHAGSTINTVGAEYRAFTDGGTTPVSTHDRGVVAELDNRQGWNSAQDRIEAGIASQGAKFGVASLTGVDDGGFPSLLSVERYVSAATNRVGAVAANIETANINHFKMGSWTTAGNFDSGTVYGVQHTFGLMSADKRVPVGTETEFVFDVNGYDRADISWDGLGGTGNLHLLVSYDGTTYETGSVYMCGYFMTSTRNAVLDNKVVLSGTYRTGMQRILGLKSGTIVAAHGMYCGNSAAETRANFWQVQGNTSAIQKIKLVLSSAGAFSAGGWVQCRAIRNI